MGWGVGASFISQLMMQSFLGERHDGRYMRQPVSLHTSGSREKVWDSACCPPFIWFWTPSHAIVILFLVNPFWKYLQRPAQKYVSMATVNSIKLKMTINHHIDVLTNWLQFRFCELWNFSEKLWIFLIKIVKNIFHKLAKLTIRIVRFYVLNKLKNSQFNVCYIPEVFKSVCLLDFYLVNVHFHSLRYEVF